MFSNALHNYNVKLSL